MAMERTKFVVNVALPYALPMVAARQFWGDVAGIQEAETSRSATNGDEMRRMRSIEVICGRLLQRRRNLLVFLQSKFKQT